MRYMIMYGLLAIVLAACSTKSDVERFIETNPDAYEMGKAVYEQTCAACHGINGVGQFPDNPSQRDETGRYGAPPHNEHGHTWHHADDLLYQIVREGGMGNPEDFYPMPAFGETLSTEQIEAVIFYIKTFWTEEQRQNHANMNEAVQNQ